MTDDESLEEKRRKNKVRCKRWREKNPEQSRKLTREWRENNPEQIRKISRIWRGLPNPPYPSPKACECCGGPPGKKALNLDHCHKTGEFRGWLCSRCNKGLGMFGDNIAGVLKVVNYLKKADRPREGK